MDVYLKKTASGLVPLNDSDYENLKKYKIGDEIKAKISKPRNIKFHKLFFALLNMAFENQEQYQDFEIFRSIMTMKAGYYEEVKTDKGLVFLPKSISFANMDQAEFETLYSKMVDEVIKLIGATEEDIEQNIINFM